MPMCAVGHSCLATPALLLTLRVSCCRELTQNYISVTLCSRVRDNYSPQAHRQQRCQYLPGPSVSGARQHGHPGFPLFLRPPGARSISTKPRSENCGALSFPTHERRRHPERCRLASFPSTQSNPCQFNLGARVAQRLPVKVLYFRKQETCHAYRSGRQALMALP